MTITKLPKTDFKRMHKNGELLLLGAPMLPLRDTADIVESAIALETLPAARQVTPGSHGFIDDKHHKCYIDEANGIVYIERVEQGDEWRKTSSHKPKPVTTVYKVEQ